MFVKFTYSIYIWNKLSMKNTALYETISNANLYVYSSSFYLKLLTEKQLTKRCY